MEPANNRLAAPAAPWLAFTNRNAFTTRCLETRYGFASVMGSSPSGLAHSCGWMVQPLRSTRITRLHRYYELIRPCAPHRYSHPRSSRSLGFSLRIGAPGSHVPHESLNQDRAAYLPATAQPVSRSLLDFFTDPMSNLLSMAVVSFPTAHQRFTCVRLPGPHLTGVPPPFPDPFTTWDLIPTQRRVV